MPDYSKTVIYHIRCLDKSINESYVGSTVNSTSRKSGHHNACINKNNKSYNFRLYKFIRDNGGWENWEMIILEEYPECVSRIQKHIRERQVAERVNATLNTKKAYLSEEETKEQVLANHISQNIRRNIKPVICECGKSYFFTGKNRHIITKYHCQFIINNTVII